MYFACGNGVLNYPELVVRALTTMAEGNVNVKRCRVLRVRLISAPVRHKDAILFLKTSISKLQVFRLSCFCKKNLDTKRTQTRKFPVFNQPR